LSVSLFHYGKLLIPPKLTPTTCKLTLPSPPPQTPPQSFTRNSFTHHQKTIIVDVPPPALVPKSAHPHVATKRHVAAFVGGLDLCDGR